MKQSELLHIFDATAHPVVVPGADQFSSMCVLGWRFKLLSAGRSVVVPGAGRHAYCHERAV